MSEVSRDCRAARKLQRAVWMEPLEERKLFTLLTADVSLFASHSAINIGNQETFVATVLPDLGTGARPTGTVTFDDNAAAPVTVGLQSNGQAVFTTSSLPPGIDFITATYSGDTHYNPATSIPVSVTVDEHLQFVQQPRTITAGGTLGQIQVDIVNANSRVDASSSSVVTLGLSFSPTGGTFNGVTTLTATAVNGVATFTAGQLSLNTAGTYALHATGTALTITQSSIFDVVPAAASQLVIPLGTGPTSPVASGRILAPGLVVDVEDQFGNLDNNNNSRVTVSLNGQPSGTLSGQMTVTAANGVAVFNSLRIASASLTTYTLDVSDSSSTVTATTFMQQVAPDVLQAPNVAKQYVAGSNITLSTALVASGTLAFAGTATITDQSDDVLGVTSVGPSGAIKYIVSDLPAGTYTCSITYNGNHPTVTSPTFTLLVEPRFVQLTNAITHASPRVIQAGTQLNVQTQIFNTGDVYLSGALEIDVSLCLETNSGLVVEQERTEFLSVNISPNGWIFATVQPFIHASDPHGVYVAVVTVDGNTHFNGQSGLVPLTDNDQQIPVSTIGDAPTGTPVANGQTAESTNTFLIN